MAEKQLYESEFPVGEQLREERIWCDWLGMHLVPVKEKTQLELRQLIRKLIDDNRRLREERDNAGQRAEIWKSDFIRAMELNDKLVEQRDNKQAMLDGYISQCAEHERHRRQLQEWNDGLTKEMALMESKIEELKEDLANKEAGAPWMNKDE